MKDNIWNYSIAGFAIEIIGHTDTSPLDPLWAFSRFKTKKTDEKPILTYRTDASLSDMDMIYDSLSSNRSLYDFEFCEIVCSFYRIGEKNVFMMKPSEGKVHLFYTEDASDGSGVRRLKVISNYEENPNPTLLRFSLWMAFGLAVAPLKAFLIHSSVIEYKGEAYLFLGESGTGKSTHTGLWRQNVPGATLLNDDSPVLRVVDGKVYAYGSPWSGKTPCYRCEHFPVAAVVRLYQAPFNHAEHISIVSSFRAMYPSCPPAFGKDEPISDMICDTLSDILTSVPVFNLQCLPDADAVKVIMAEINNFKRR